MNQSGETESANDFTAAEVIAKEIISAKLPSITRIIAGSVRQGNFVYGHKMKTNLAFASEYV